MKRVSKFLKMMYTPIMRRCIIITSYLDGKIKDLVDISHEDYIICADGGYDLAVAAEITPDMVLGDFDSSKLKIPDNINMRAVPSKKDVTDTALCLEHALAVGFTSTLIIGGIGGRLDHTLANIQNLFKYKRAGLSIMMIDKDNIVIPLTNDSVVIPRRNQYNLSLFSFSNSCIGVTATGVEYALSNATLSSEFPLGVSNVFSKSSDEALISVEKGSLLIIMSRESSSDYFHV